MTRAERKIDDRPNRAKRMRYSLVPALALILFVAASSLFSMKPVSTETRSQCVIFETGIWYDISQTREINNYSKSNNMGYKTLDCYDLRYVK